MKNVIKGLIVVVLLATGFVGCKDKKAPKKVQKPKKTIVDKKKKKKDTAKVDSSLIAKPKKVVKETLPPPPENKYFLIAGSFQSMANAEKFKAQLMEEGFQAEIIERSTGPNVDFYKVAYKAFYDKSEALSELRTARNVEMKSDVWLLIKR